MNGHDEDTPGNLGDQSEFWMQHSLISSPPIGEEVSWNGRTLVSTPDKLLLTTMKTLAQKVESRVLYKQSSA